MVQKLGKRPAVFAAVITSALLIAQQVMLKATRDALFLGAFDVAKLPWMMIGAAAFSVFGVIAMSRLMTAYSPARVLPLALGVSAMLLVTEWALAYRAPRLIAIATFLHVAAFGATLISAFWSLVDETFDPATAKRAIASIAGGGTLGGLLGGVLAWQLGPNTSVRTMLMASAITHVLAAFALLPLHGRREPVAKPQEVCGDAGDGYLASLGLLVMLVAMSEAVMDYLLGAHATATYAKSSLLSFFAVFHAVTGVLTLLLQTVATRAALHRLGVAGTVSALPLTVLATTALATLSSFGTVILRGASAIVSRSLYRSAYELLFTPLPDGRRRAFKTLIDVGFERFGAALGGGALLIVLFLAPARATPIATAILVVLSVAALVVVRKLHRGYLGALQGRLRAGVSTLESQEFEFVIPASEEVSPPSRDRVLEATTILRTGPRERVSQLLARDGALDPALIPHVIALLARDEHVDEATAALQRGFERGVGQLVDALLDRAQPIAVRWRVARALRASSSPRAVAGLVEGLRDPEFDVRYESGRSLLTIVRRESRLRPSEQDLLSAVQHEIDVDRASWVARARVTSPRMRQSFDHVFTLLSLTHGDEALRLASRALDVKDRALRGTALEYLETVLPDGIREQLWPYVAPERRSVA